MNIITQYKSSVVCYEYSDGAIDFNGLRYNYRYLDNISYDRIYNIHNYICAYCSKNYFTEPYNDYIEPLEILIE